MVVMRRKARAKQLLSEKNTASGAFALSYTNTGKHLMGRTASRAKILPPLLRAFKNRRVDCCGGPSETVIKNVCVGSSKGIKKVPIRQISNRNRLKRLALKCSDGKCRDLNTNPLWQLSPEQHASARTERLAAMVLNSENGCIFRIVKGILSEQIFNSDLKRLSRRVLGKDIIGYIDNDNGYHKIRNILDDYSVSVHLYSPRGYIANTFD